jgi:hypothetical protein
MDFVEKLPPLSDQQAQSPRGLPLFKYKLVISRSIVRASVILIALAAAGCSYFPDRSEPAQRGASSSATRSIDTLCMNDCLGSGATKEFCEDRCTY